MSSKRAEGRLVDPKCMRYLPVRMGLEPFLEGKVNSQSKPWVNRIWIDVKKVQSLLILIRCL